MYGSTFGRFLFAAHDQAVPSSDRIAASKETSSNALGLLGQDRVVRRALATLHACTSPIAPRTLCHRARLAPDHAGSAPSRRVDLPVAAPSRVCPRGPRYRVG
ncbi:hypothetical protein GUJ93_ZPchr0009g1882 [Zizania palustris]|uniref:Uncharacterized protein n=1 Tax=Zizania palustris TaxID=103762 RepID=A0A8J5RYI5_ZIZPA|nr:hypothetical protein GUJ93_ZPchr0009g1882 [Zizania palustris]